jgi:Flp pilus assembly protein TadD
VEIQPSNAQGFHHLGIILAELNRFDEAISSYHSAIQLDKNDAAIHYHLGIALAGSGDLERSRDSFQAARTLSPEDSDVAYNLAMIHGLLGKQLEMSDPEGARKHYQSALELQPGMPDIQDRLEKLMTVP